MGLVVGHDAGLDHDAHLTAGLDGEGLLHAGHRHGQLFEPAEPFNVGGHGLGPGAGTRGGDGVGEDHEPGVDRLGLDLGVVGGDGVDHDAGLTVAADEVRPDDRVTALVFALDGLADIVEQAGALGDVGLEPELGREHRAELRHLDGVVEDVLRVGKTEAQLAEQLDGLGVQAGDLQPVHGLLANRGDVQIHLLPGAVDRLLDAGRVDATILHQRLERELGDLAAHGVKRRDEHHLRGLVDEQRGAGGGLEGFDVAALAADDAALHLLGGQLDDRGGEVVVGLAGEALHRGDEDALALLHEVLLGTLKQLLAQGAQLLGALKGDFLDQLLADLLAIERGDAFQALAQALGQVAHGVARLLDGGGLAGQPVLPLLQLVVEQAERLLVRTDFPQHNLDLDLAAVKFPVQLGLAVADVLLGLVDDLLRGHSGLALRQRQVGGGLLASQAAGLAQKQPDGGITGRQPQQNGQAQGPQVGLGFCGLAHLLG